MFASLKSKIKEETGNDISKITSSWRSGAFLNRLTNRDDSSTVANSVSSSTNTDTVSDSMSTQFESYISDKTGGHIDQSALYQQYLSQLETKIHERDAYWKQQMEELRESILTLQNKETLAAQAVARTAQAELASTVAERDALLKQLNDLKTRLASADYTESRLDQITEEFEEQRRAWAQERSALAAAAAAAEERVRDLAAKLDLARAALPADEEGEAGCAGCARGARERGVLARQLSEARLALADIKTSWSAHIASLETQVARLSIQTGEEGAERRRVETEKKAIQDKLDKTAAELEKTKQNLINSEAKVMRLNSEVHTLALEAKTLRSSAERAAENTMELERKLEALKEENKELLQDLECKKHKIMELEERITKLEEICETHKMEANHVNSLYTEMQHDLIDLQKKYEREKHEKDCALLRNAHVSQALEVREREARRAEADAEDLRSALATHVENEAICMLIKQNEEIRIQEITNLKKQVDKLETEETCLKKTIKNLEVEISDKNKKIKSLDSRISDMKKTLQQELQSTKSDLTSAEEQEISRRYLKHVVFRFLTARELEARHLTRALAVLLRLSAREEAELRAARAPWLPSLASLTGT